jgi:hypothetical protein
MSWADAGEVPLCLRRRCRVQNAVRADSYSMAKNAATNGKIARKGGHDVE